MIKFDEIKHFNEPGQLFEGHIFKINNADNVFFILEKVVPVIKADENGEQYINEEYIARKLDGRTFEELKYNSNNETKRLSFEDDALMKVEHLFAYGQMFKTFA